MAGSQRCDCWGQNPTAKKLGFSRAEHMVVSYNPRKYAHGAVFACTANKKDYLFQYAKHYLSGLVYVQSAKNLVKLPIGCGVTVPAKKHNKAIFIGLSFYRAEGKSIRAPTCLLQMADSNFEFVELQHIRITAVEQPLPKEKLAKV